MFQEPIRVLKNECIRSGPRCELQGPSLKMLKTVFDIRRISLQRTGKGESKLGFPVDDFECCIKCINAIIFTLHVCTLHDTQAIKTQHRHDSTNKIACMWIGNLETGWWTYSVKLCECVNYGFVIVVKIWLKFSTLTGKFCNFHNAVNYKEKVLS